MARRTRQAHSQVFTARRVAGVIGAAMLAVLAGCGGSGDDDEVEPEQGKLYYGYYLEDPLDNPEDPTPGTLVVNLPAGPGAFSGQMPFSYVGCLGGADIGTITGQRTDTALTGQWTGVVDNVPVGGGYIGTYNAANDQFDGTYTNAGGKVHVTGPNDCSHHIAAKGTWRLYGDTVSTPSSFVVSSTGGVSPTWSWPSLGSAVFYLVRVFDQKCLAQSVTSAECMTGEGQTLLNRIDYPAGFPEAKPLKDGGSYLIAVHAIDVADGRKQIGFTTRIEKP